MIRENSDYFVKYLLTPDRNISALNFALEAQTKSAQVNFDLSDIDSVYKKVLEEYIEMQEAYNERGKNFDHFKEELWDCFFALINLCRWSGLNPEELLSANVKKYLKRCEFIENALLVDKKNWAETNEEDIKKLWKQAKVSWL
jgi:tetrapyrrole methylase family protein / MazG family protein